MPFFGPNIKKMTAENNAPALRKLLGNENLKTVQEALRALETLQDLDGLVEGMRSEIFPVRMQAAQLLKRASGHGSIYLDKCLLDDLNFGNTQRKLEAMAIVQGRLPIVSVPGLKSTAFDIAELDVLTQAASEEVTKAIKQIAQDPNMMVSWFAKITLVELGVHDKQSALSILELAKTFMNFLEETAYQESAVAEETIRALHHFMDDNDVREALRAALDGSLFPGDWYYVKRAQQCAAIAAFAVEDDEANRRVLDYLTQQGNDQQKQQSQRVMGLIGTASYDRIHRAIHPKDGEV